MAKQELTEAQIEELLEQQAAEIDPGAAAKLMASETISILDDSQREELNNRSVPYGVNLLSKMFYFGPDSPTEESWEIAGDWVETENGVEISRVEVFPSRRIVMSNGETVERARGSAPRGGLNRDIMRKLGSDAPLKRAILRQKDIEAKHLVELSGGDSDQLPDWGSELVDESRERKAEDEDRGHGFEWWVARADEYLAVVEILGTSYGAQAQLAEQRDDHWKVSDAGIRWRVNRFYEKGLVAGTRSLTGAGPNHPNKKGTHDGKNT